MASPLPVLSHKVSQVQLPSSNCSQALTRIHSSGRRPPLLPPPPQLLSRLKKPQSRRSQWEKIQIAQLLCLSFPILETHQFPLPNLLWLIVGQLHRGRRIPGPVGGSSVGLREP